MPDALPARAVTRGPSVIAWSLFGLAGIGVAHLLVSNLVFWSGSGPLLSTAELTRRVQAMAYGFGGAGTALAAALLVGLVLFAGALRAPPARGAAVVAVGAAGLHLVIRIAYLLGGLLGGHALFVVLRVVDAAAVTGVAAGFAWAVRRSGPGGAPRLAALGVAPAALALLVAIHVLVDSIARARGVGVVTLGVVWRYAGWAGSPVAFILLGLLALAARRELARDAAGAAPPERGRGWRAAGEGLATLRAAVAWRIVLAVGGVVLIRVAMALDAPDAARILCWAMFLAGAVTALVILGALVSIGRMPEATGLAVVVGVLGLLGLILDGAATVLTARMLIKPTGFWGGGLHEALEAARILPTISVGAGVLGLATSASTFGLLGALARTVGDEDARARAVGGAAMAVLAGLFLTVSQASALASRAFVPLLALSALGGLAIAIAVLVRFLGLTRTLGETLRG